MKNTILFSILLLAACTKGGPAAGGPQLEGSWRPVSERANGQELWVPYYYPPCRLDDRWIFDPSGHYFVADSGMTCSASTSAAHAGTWKLDEGALVLDSVVYQVSSFSEQGFTLERQRNMNGFRVLYELEFAR